MNKTDLAREAVRSASVLRAKYGIGPAEGLCPYDLAIKLEIKVAIMQASSLEGMYSPDPQPATIILSSERPAGRRRYTCGHELGHHIFNHGCRIDELNEKNSSPWSPEEYLAQRFSSALLMPKIAVDSAFSRRGWAINTAKPEYFYMVAQELGVGYTTLITNIQMNFNSLSKTQADCLRNIPLGRIRESVAGVPIGNDAFVVDEHWNRATVDVEVGDLIVLPTGGEIDGSLASRESGNRQHFTAMGPGIAKIDLGSGLKSPSLRVSKRGFTGLARYRHLEEVVDGE